MSPYTDDSVKYIKRHLLMFTDYQVVAETCKRIIIRFQNDYEARGFALDMRREGYSASARRGRRSEAFYTQVLL